MSSDNAQEMPVTGMANRESEEDLQRLRSGEVAAFEQLVRRHHRALIAAARPLVGDEAEEVVQNAWIKAHRALPEFEGRSAVRTWLTRIVLNEAKMLLRKRGREVSLEDTTGGDADPQSWRFGSRGGWALPPRYWQVEGPHEVLSSDQLLECLQRLFGEMPGNQKALLEMRDVSGMDFEEICNDLNVSASNARVLLHRARGRVFELVDHYQETGEC